MPPATPDDTDPLRSPPTKENPRSPSVTSTTSSTTTGTTYSHIPSPHVAKFGRKRVHFPDDPTTEITYFPRHLVVESQQHSSSSSSGSYTAPAIIEAATGKEHSVSPVRLHECLECDNVDRTTGQGPGGEPVYGSQDHKRNVEVTQQYGHNNNDSHALLQGASPEDRVPDHAGYISSSSSRTAPPPLARPLHLSKGDKDLFVDLLISPGNPSSSALPPSPISLSLIHSPKSLIDIAHSHCLIAKPSVDACDDTKDCVELPLQQQHNFPAASATDSPQPFRPGHRRTRTSLLGSLSSRNLLPLTNRPSPVHPPSASPSLISPKDESPMTSATTSMIPGHFNTSAPHSTATCRPNQLRTKFDSTASTLNTSCGPGAGLSSKPSVRPRSSTIQPIARLVTSNAMNAHYSTSNDRILRSRPTDYYNAYSSSPPASVSSPITPFSISTPHRSLFYSSSHSKRSQQPQFPTPPPKFNPPPVLTATDIPLAEETVLPRRLKLSPPSSSSSILVKAEDRYRDVIAESSLPSAAPTILSPWLTTLIIPASPSKPATPSPPSPRRLQLWSPSSSQQTMSLIETVETYCVNQQHSGVAATMIPTTTTTTTAAADGSPPVRSRTVKSTPGLRRLSATLSFIPHNTRARSGSFLEAVLAAANGRSTPPGALNIAVGPDTVTTSNTTPTVATSSSMVSSNINTGHDRIQAPSALEETTSGLTVADERSSPSSSIGPDPTSGSGPNNNGASPPLSFRHQLRRKLSFFKSKKKKSDLSSPPPPFKSIEHR